MKFTESPADLPLKYIYKNRIYDSNLDDSIQNNQCGFLISLESCRARSLLHVPNCLDIESSYNKAFAWMVQ
jgi:hypothetical protein